MKKKCHWGSSDGGGGEGFGPQGEEVVRESKNKKLWFVEFFNILNSI